MKLHLRALLSSRAVASLLTVLLLPLPLHAATSPVSAMNTATLGRQLAESNPTKLMRRVSQNELANSYGHRPPMRYWVRKITAHMDMTKEIVETREGGVARLIAVRGNPPSVGQNQKEIERLRAIAANPAIEAHRRDNERRDAKRVQKYMRLLPSAFVYRFAGMRDLPNGAAIQLTFTPNPAFTPPDFASRILTGIQGEIWIDPTDLRVIRMDGHIFRTVDFGWGILGSLYPGATMRIEQTKTRECGWQMTRLSLHLNGRELLFKSLHIVVDETADDYRLTPPTWNYKDAVQWLLQTPIEKL